MMVDTSVIKKVNIIYRQWENTKADSLSRNPLVPVVQVAAVTTAHIRIMPDGWPCQPESDSNVFKDGQQKDPE